MVMVARQADVVRRTASDARTGAPSLARQAEIVRCSGTRCTGAPSLARQAEIVRCSGTRCTGAPSLARQAEIVRCSGTRCVGAPGLARQADTVRAMAFDADSVATSAEFERLWSRGSQRGVHQGLPPPSRLSRQ